MNQAANVTCGWLLTGFSPEEQREVPKGVRSPTRKRSVSERTRGRRDAVVGRFIYRCGDDKKKMKSGPLYTNNNPTLKKRISYSWRLSINSQAGGVHPSACSHSWQLQGHVVFTTGLASVFLSWLKGVTSRFVKVAYSVTVSIYLQRLLQGVTLWSKRHRRS